MKVLNLIINGLPSILSDLTSKEFTRIDVLNLIINGLPSILYGKCSGIECIYSKSFKPYYKWITFNTE